MILKSRAIAAGGFITLPRGTFLSVKQTTAPVTIEVIDDGGQAFSVPSISGGINFTHRNPDGSLKTFTSVKISSATAQSVECGTGYGDIERTVMSGDVTVSGDVFTLPSATYLDNGQDFFWQGNDVGAAAGETSGVNLLNQAGSGINVYVKAISITNIDASAANFVICRGAPAAGASTGANKKFGGPVSQAFGQSWSVAAPAVTQLWRVARNVLTNETVNPDLSGGILLEPGQAVSVIADAVQRDLEVMFDWREVAI